MKIINIYTDGACSGNPGKGGWGVVILDNNKEILLNGKAGLFFKMNDYKDLSKKIIYVFI